MGVNSSEKELVIDRIAHAGTPSLSEDFSGALFWTKALNKLKTKLDPQLYSTWVKPLEYDGVENKPDSCAFVVSAPNKFSAEHVRVAYGDLIKQALEEETERSAIELKIISKSSSSIPSSAQLKQVKYNSAPAVRPPKRGAKSNTRQEETNLNTKYNFSNFVVGGCNQFAHAASVRVAEHLGANYNPLFIYGGVGLGKTHLANAIGNAAWRRGKKVLLVSSEIFVNELITSLRNNRMQEFKERFRSLDLLIVDDIQFIIGKERTQEEFFHTFNALYQNRKQIVITSDKVPQDLVGLEERLSTRFASGLSADLQAPDYETRVAILERKAEIDSLALPEGVAQFLAAKIDTNVRELEGALNRLHAISSLNNVPFTLELAEGALSSIVGSRTREITIELIQKTVAEKFSLQVKDLIGKRRTQHIALPRQVAMYLCRKLTTSSYPEIGSHFGGRDHSTVIHAFRVVEERMQNIDSLLNDIKELERKLRT